MKTFKIAAAFCCLLLATACTVDGQKVRGNGDIRTEDRTAGSFNKISCAGIYHVYLTQGSSTSVKLEADANLMPFLRTEVHGNTLELSVKPRTNIDPSRTVKVYVTTPRIEALNISGVCEIESRNTLQVKDLKIGVSGSGELDLDLTADAVKTDVSGTGKVELEGKSTEAEYHISGTGKVSADDLRTARTSVSISGMGKLEVYATEKLDVSVSGMGEVRYKGNPQIHQSVSGMGSIRQE
ncbi:head GIN domain-containing protein [Compostibacter hankyongensis]|uniref:Head GIN domain-containing protein n=1 Tax=Compostibacter hankyongensis TaxID=1007089 RepID=A0ABP8FQ71_9BACT